ncbi:MAG: invasion associated locus B family protein [Paracoccus sp. (in: a-proteobacteria)]
MSPKVTSTALATVFALTAMPLFAQTAATETPAADPAAVAAEAAQTAGEAGEAAVTDAANAAADAANAAASDAAAAAADAASAAVDAAAETQPAADAAGSGEPQVGAYYVRATHGDWSLRCIKTEEGLDPCELYQLLKDGQGNSVAEITLIPLENGSKAAAGATIVTPLETDLVRGIGMKVDSGAAKAYPFNFCSPVGCVSRLGLTADELAGLKRGNAATVMVMPYGAPDGEPVDLKMSLAGFTAGFGDLETIVADLRKAAEAAAAAAPAEAAPAEAAPAE